MYNIVYICIKVYNVVYICSIYHINLTLIKFSHPPPPKKKKTYIANTI